MGQRAVNKSCLQLCKAEVCTARHVCRSPLSSGRACQQIRGVARLGCPRSRRHRSGTGGQRAPCDGAPQSLRCRLPRERRRDLLRSVSRIHRALATGAAPALRRALKEGQRGIRGRSSKSFHPRQECASSTGESCRR